LRRTVRNILWLFIAFAAVLVLSSGFDLRSSELLPGYQVALALLGINPVLHLAIVAVEAALLLGADFFLQREAVYSGISGPAATRASYWFRGRFLLFRPSPAA